MESSALKEGSSASGKLGPSDWASQVWAGLSTFLSQGRRPAIGSSFQGAVTGMVSHSYPTSNCGLSCFRSSPFSPLGTLEFVNLSALKYLLES